VRIYGLDFTSAPGRDPSADALDSLLCAVQAAWAYTQRDDNYGVPPECDPDEGWILDPALLDESR